MKKYFFVAIMLIVGHTVFSQHLPTVAVATFDTMGGVTNDEAQVITELFMTELVSKGKVNVVDRVNFDKIIAEMRFQTTDWSDSQKTAQLGRALNAGYVIRGQLMKMGNVIYWTATMIDVNTAQVLYSAREQLNDISEVFGKLSGFCSQMIARIPAPNYFIGRWRSVVSDLTCIIEFLPNGNIRVSQYDFYTSNSTRRGITGTGNYSVDSNNVNIILSLSNSPNSNVQTRTSYSFDGTRNSFTLTNGLVCDSTSNPYIYKNFVKIQ